MLQACLINSQRMLVCQTTMPYQKLVHVLIHPLIKRQKRSHQLQSVQRILVEGASRKSAAELMGRTQCNRIVNFDGGPQSARLVGQMIDVRITQALPHSLRGAVVTCSAAAMAVASPALPPEGQTTLRLPSAFAWLHNSPMPRSLNEPLGCRFSIFNQIRRVGVDRPRCRINGVLM